ncbi:MAG: acyl carrier protein [Lachnospiraceae bacterium]|nr:acyl carrier protein [Clostridiales bacterium]MCD8396988.1 acyl carrier protein [Lachnospiraceae bacterium]
MEQQVLELLKEEYPEIEFETTKRLWDDGILDSVTLIGIVGALNMEFGISIPYVEIIEANFNSVAGMARLVEKLQAAK